MKSSLLSRDDVRLNLRIDATLEKPLYKQLVDGIAGQIRSGLLADGRKLPSVRDLAVDLRINPNTVARAYRELENEGVARSERGRGVFVSYADHLRDTGLPRDVEHAIQRLVELAMEKNLSEEAMVSAFRDVYRSSTFNEPDLPKGGS